jgi:hypothetical protein
MRSWMSATISLASVVMTANAAVPHVHAIDDAITKWPAALDDSPTHARECRSPFPAVNFAAGINLTPARALTG